MSSGQRVPRIRNFYEDEVSTGSDDEQDTYDAAEHEQFLRAAEAERKKRIEEREALLTRIESGAAAGYGAASEVFVGEESAATHTERDPKIWSFPVGRHHELDALIGISSHLASLALRRQPTFAASVFFPDRQPGTLYAEAHRLEHVTAMLESCLRAGVASLSRAAIGGVRQVQAPQFDAVLLAAEHRAAGALPPPRSFVRLSAPREHRGDVAYVAAVDPERRVLTVLVAPRLAPEAEGFATFPRHGDARTRLPPALLPRSELVRYFSPDKIRRDPARELPGGSVYAVDVPVFTASNVFKPEDRGTGAGGISALAAAARTPAVLLTEHGHRVLRVGAGSAVPVEPRNADIQLLIPPDLGVGAAEEAEEAEGRPEAEAGVNETSAIMASLDRSEVLHDLFTALQSAAPATSFFANDLVLGRGPAGSAKLRGCVGMIVRSESERSYVVRSTGVLATRLTGSIEQRARAGAREAARRAASGSPDAPRDVIIADTELMPLIWTGCTVTVHEEGTTYTAVVDAVDTLRAKVTVVHSGTAAVAAGAGAAAAAAAAAAAGADSGMNVGGLVRSDVGAECITVGAAEAAGVQSSGTVRVGDLVRYALSEESTGIVLAFMPGDQARVLNIKNETITVPAPALQPRRSLEALQDSAGAPIQRSDRVHITSSRYEGSRGTVVALANETVFVQLEDARRGFAAVSPQVVQAEVTFAARRAAGAAGAGAELRTPMLTLTPSGVGATPGFGGRGGQRGARGPAARFIGRRMRLKHIPAFPQYKGFEATIRRADANFFHVDVAGANTTIKIRREGNQFTIIDDRLPVNEAPVPVAVAAGEQTGAFQAASSVSAASSESSGWDKTTW